VARSGITAERERERERDTSEKSFPSVYLDKNNAIKYGGFKG